MTTLSFAFTGYDVNAARDGVTFKFFSFRTRCTQVFHDEKLMKMMRMRKKIVKKRRKRKRERAKREESDDEAREINLHANNKIINM